VAVCAGSACNQRIFDILVASSTSKVLQRRRLIKFLDTLKAMNLLRNEWEKKLELGPEEMVICASIVSTFQGTQGHLILTTSRVIWRANQSKRKESSKKSTIIIAFSELESVEKVCISTMMVVSLSLSLSLSFYVCVCVWSIRLTSDVVVQ
jgi:hypothetical protein